LNRNPWTDLGCAHSHGKSLLALMGETAPPAFWPFRARSTTHRGASCGAGERIQHATRPERTARVNSIVPRRGKRACSGYR
jgi:hypothetical protein